MCPDPLLQAVEDMKCRAEHETTTVVIVMVVVVAVEVGVLWRELVCHEHSLGLDSANS